MGEGVDRRPGVDVYREPVHADAEVRPPRCSARSTLYPTEFSPAGSPASVGRAVFVRPDQRTALWWVDHD